MTSYRARIYECDGCGRRVPENEPGIEPAYGYHFRGIMHVHAGGGDTFADDVFACDVDCLHPALAKAEVHYRRRGEREERLTALPDDCIAIDPDDCHGIDQCRVCWRG